MICPTPPRPGDLIALVCPSSPLSERENMQEIQNAVMSLGFRVYLGESCRCETDCGYAAAPASVKAQDINRAFADPEVKAVWCVRGGSTAWQVLPLLDYTLIAGHPKPLIGFSDVTTLHLALGQRCGLVTYHGPTANRVLSWGETDGFSWRSLQRALSLESGLTIENPPGEPIRILRPGRASGVLTGGESVPGDRLCGYTLADQRQRPHPLPGGRGGGGLFFGPDAQPASVCRDSGGRGGAGIRPILQLPQRLPGVLRP